MTYLEIMPFQREQKKNLVFRNAGTVGILSLPTDSNKAMHLPPI